MKIDIHPTYYSDTTVTCACGVVRMVGSTMQKIDVEICSACHPFFTGEQKIMDTAGRVERYKKRVTVASTFVPKKKKVFVKKVQASEKQKTAVKKAKTAPKEKESAAEIKA